MVEVVKDVEQTSTLDVMVDGSLVPDGEEVQTPVVEDMKSGGMVTTVEDRSLVVPYNDEDVTLVEDLKDVEVVPAVQEPLVEEQKGIDLVPAQTMKVHGPVVPAVEDGAIKETEGGMTISTCSGVLERSMGTPVEDQEMRKMDRRLVGGDVKPMVSKKSVMVELVEPGRNIGPIKRRRGRGKRRMGSNIPEEGKIKHYFTDWSQKEWLT